jgi:hypothetical protein
MHSKDKEPQHSRMASLMPILISAIAVPLAMLMWLGNMAFTFFTGADSHRDSKYYIISHNVQDSIRQRPYNFRLVVKILSSESEIPVPSVIRR